MDWLLPVLVPVLLFEVAVLAVMVVVVQTMRSEESAAVAREGRHPPEA